MDDEPYSIKNAINYYKWKIFGKTCRIFGVAHFINSTPQEKIDMCQVPP